MRLDRRTFVLTGLAAAATRAVAGPVRFGVIADVHHGLAPDASERLSAFLDAAIADGRLDFIVQLGDFCHPTPEAEPFIAQLERFGGPVHHVLGNHDMDRGTKADILRRWGSPAPYYCFAAGGWRFIVLDLNHIQTDGGLLHYEHGNYFRHAQLNRAGPEQLRWLAAELARSPAPAIVLSHQPIGATRPDGTLPGEQAEILAVLRDSPAAACLYGHLHVDRHDVHQGLQCVGVNSASYHWAGAMHPYRDPLFALVELDGAHMAIRGRWSSYAADDPRAGPAREVLGANPWISDRRLELLGRD